jgi:hypothetical protein
MNYTCEMLFEQHPTHERLYDEYIKELLNKPDDIFVNLDEYHDEDAEPCYAYFSVINPVYVNGIMFLHP